MTDEPTVEEEALPQSSMVNCRHCGAEYELDAYASPDWECPACGHHQDALLCPTCHQVARISLLPAEVVPEPHAPAAKRRSAKEN